MVTPKNAEVPARAKCARLAGLLLPVLGGVSGLVVGYSLARLAWGALNLYWWWQNFVK